MKDYGLFFFSTADILDFLVYFGPRTLSALNDFLRNYDFMMIMIQDFSTTNELPKHHFTLISLKFLFKNVIRECVKV